MFRVRYVATRRHHRARPRHAARVRRRGQLVAAARRPERRAPHRGVRRLRPHLPDRLLRSARLARPTASSIPTTGWSPRSSARSTTSSSTPWRPPTQALEDAGWKADTQEKQERTGVLIGSGIGGLSGIAETSLLLKEKGPRRVSPFFIPGPADQSGRRLRLDPARPQGPQPRRRHGLLDRRARHRRCRAADRARTMPTSWWPAAPKARSAASASPASPPAGRSRPASTTGPTKASRPYDKDRDGFVMGEGAGIVVLEELEHAKARGARIYAEVIGYGLSGDAYHITAPAEDGDGAYRCMRMALKRAGIEPERHRLRQRPRHLDADGRRDRARAPSSGCSATPPASSPCRRPSRRSGICSAPPARSRRSSRCWPSATTSRRRRSTSTTRRSRPRSISCRTRRRSATIDTVLSNSFGFGGTNASLVLRRSRRSARDPTRRLRSVPMLLASRIDRVDAPIRVAKPLPSHRPFATFTLKLRPRIDSRCKNGARRQLEGAVRAPPGAEHEKPPAGGPADGPAFSRTSGTLTRSPAERLEPTRPPTRPRRHRLRPRAAPLEPAAALPQRPLHASPCC